MTHLKIQLNNIPETVTTALLDKLYGIVSANDYVYHSDDLQGTLLVDKAYEDTIAYLQQRYPDLHITATTWYIRFADPEVERIFKDLTLTQNNTYVIGDGTGIPSNGDFTKFPTLNYGWFNGNTTIKYFNELSKAVGCHSINGSAFKGCTNLQEIDLLNIVEVGTNAFLNCSSLTSIGHTNNLLMIGTQSFYNTKLTEISFPSIKTIQNLAFRNIPTLSIIDFGETLQSMNWQSVWSCSSGLKMIFRGNTPPTVNGDDTRLYDKSFTIYIPDGCKEAYIQEPHFAANESKIHFISELSS